MFAFFSQCRYLVDWFQHVKTAKTHQQQLDVFSSIIGLYVGIFKGQIQRRRAAKRLEGWISLAQQPQVFCQIYEMCGQHGYIPWHITRSMAKFASRLDVSCGHSSYLRQWPQWLRFPDRLQPQKRKLSEAWRSTRASRVQTKYLEDAGPLGFTSAAGESVATGADPHAPGASHWSQGPDLTMLKGEGENLKRRAAWSTKQTDKILRRRHPKQGA